LNFGWSHLTGLSEDVEQMRRKTLEVRALDHLSQTLHYPDFPVHLDAVVLMLREVADQLDGHDLIRLQAFRFHDLAEASSTQLFHNLVVVVDGCHPDVGQTELGQNRGGIFQVGLLVGLEICVLAELEWFGVESGDFVRAGLHL
jgi:hypothetical protein